MENNVLPMKKKKS